VRVDAAHGFALCPADTCAVPANTMTEEASPRPAFAIIEGFASPLITKFEAFLAANDIGIAGIEIIVDENGTAWAYDVNTNTNYNSQAEDAAGLAGTPRAGMMAVARYLGERLAALREVRALEVIPIKRKAL